MSRPHLVYLHGFHSSPGSAKSTMMREYLADQHSEIEFVCPQLPATPQAAAALIDEILNTVTPEASRVGLVGSSLGGYLATYFSEKYGGLPCVLINPAVKPYELFEAYMGEQLHPYTQQRYVLNAQHIQELVALDTHELTSPNLYWLLQQQGDEVLDYKQAVEKYKNCRVTLEQGGDHAFQGFERFLSDIVKFLQLT